MYENIFLIKKRMPWHGLDKCVGDEGRGSGGRFVEN